MVRGQFLRLWTMSNIDIDRAGDVNMEGLGSIMHDNQNPCQILLQLHKEDLYDYKSQRNKKK